MAKQTKTIKVDGMSCTRCVESIHIGTVDVQGLMNIAVDLANAQSTVTFEDSQTSAETIAAVIEGIGFDATVVRS